MVHLQVVLEREVIELLVKSIRCGNSLSVLQVIAGTDAIFELLREDRRLERALAKFVKQALVLFLSLQRVSGPL